MSAFERRLDNGYFFLGAELKMDYVRSFDVVLKALSRRSPAVERVFYRLIDEAASMDEPDLDMFKLTAAVKGLVFDGISEDGQNYLLLKAFRRGMSLKRMRMLKETLVSHDKIMRNSMYGLYPNPAGTPARVSKIKV